jgi:hypothetical protein
VGNACKSNAHQQSREGRCFLEGLRCIRVVSLTLHAARVTDSEEPDANDRLSVATLKRHDKLLYPKKGRILIEWKGLYA